MEIQEEIDLRQVFDVVRRRLWVLVVMVVTATLVSGVFSFYFIPPTYTASVTLLVAKRETPVADYSTLLLNQNLVRTYAEIARSRTVAQRVVDALGLHTTVSSLQERINVTAVKDTQVIRVSLEGPTPQEAQLTADAVAAAFTDQVQSLMKVDNVAIVDPAVQPTSPTKPRPLLNIAVAMMLGVMVGFGLMFLLEYLDNTIKDSDDVARYLDLPVLGAIPLIDLKVEGRPVSFSDALAEQAEVAVGTAPDGPRPIQPVKRHSDGVESNLQA